MGLRFQGGYSPHPLAGLDILLGIFLGKVNFDFLLIRCQSVIFFKRKVVCILKIRKDFLNKLINQR